MSPELRAAIALVQEAGYRVVDPHQDDAPWIVQPGDGYAIVSLGDSVALDDVVEVAGQKAVVEDKEVGGKHRSLVRYLD